MNNTDLPIQIFEYSAFYISEFLNSISESTNKKDRERIKSLRTLIKSYIENTIYFVKDYSIKKDQLVLLSNATTCIDFLSNLEDVAESVDPRRYSELKESIDDSHYLFREAYNEKLDTDVSKNTKLIKYFRESINDLGKYQTFVIRLIIAKKLYRNTIKELGIYKPKSTSKIERSISFEPEFKQSGISILSYFSNIVESKYPDIDVSVKIEQKGKIITLVIITPEGYIEKIDHELSNYGLVVTGKKSPEQYLSDPNEALMLNVKSRQIINILFKQFW